MFARDNAAIARAIYEAFNKGDLDRCLTMANENVEVTMVPFAHTFRGLNGFREFMQGFRSAFPDMTLTVTNQIASDNSVVNEFVVRGTHKGTLVGPAGAIPATGKKIDYPVIEV